MGVLDVHSAIDVSDPTRWSEEGMTDSEIYLFHGEFIS